MVQAEKILNYVTTVFLDTVPDLIRSPKCTLVLGFTIQCIQKGGSGFPFRSAES